MSQVIQLKDKYGNSLNFGNGGDVWLPPFSNIRDYRQHLNNIRHLELEPDDVIIAGFPKSGIHWHQEIVSMLLDRSTDYHGTTAVGVFFEATPKERIIPANKPRLFITHLLGCTWEIAEGHQSSGNELPNNGFLVTTGVRSKQMFTYRPPQNVIPSKMYRHLPLQVWEKNVKVIYLTRNPKDTWVSLYNFINNFTDAIAYEGTWDHFFELMMSMGYYYGDWFDYVMDWKTKIEEDPKLNILTSNYEDMLKDPVQQIEKIDQFLSLNSGRAFCAKIAEACKFQNLKAGISDSLVNESLKKTWKPNAPGFFRKGEVGDWKNWFTVAQNERFEDLVSSRPAVGNLTFTYQ